MDDFTTSTNGPQQMLRGMKIVPSYLIPDDTIFVSEKVFKQLTGMTAEEAFARAKPSDPSREGESG